MANEKKPRPGYGKLLDVWSPPPSAGAPVGCVATSFTFSSAFFEEECLGRFLGLESDPDEDGAVYLVEREEKLAQVICAAALVDQYHCRGARTLRWDLLPIRPQGGLLHAKVTLLVWSDHVRLVVASANLTDDGYRRNQEAFAALDYHPGGAAPIECLREMIVFLRECTALAQSPRQPLSAAQERVTRLLDRVETIPDDWGTATHRSGVVRVTPVLVGPGRQDALLQLRSIWPSGSPPKEAHVVSPFFDSPEVPNKPAKALWGVLRKRGEATVHFHVVTDPISADDGEGLLLHAPQSLLDAQPGGPRKLETRLHAVQLTDFSSDDKPYRPLHAKVILLTNSRWVAYMMGSSNFTSHGLGLAAQPNLEANLVFCAHRERNAADARRLWNALPPSAPIDATLPLRWLREQAPGEDEIADGPALPMFFGAATYRRDLGKAAVVTLSFGTCPPSEWAITTEDGKPLLNGNQWRSQGRPSSIDIAWSEERPPYGLLVTWEGASEAAWLPVNIGSPEDLPPPVELRDLPLAVLVNILTSARPLHRLLRSHLARAQRPKDNGISGTSILDPHKRVDTSRFLLQRTRRVARALTALRERLERPVATREALQWRLFGPIGVAAFADAIEKEANSDEERAFLLCELAIELSRVTPADLPGALPASEVRTAIGTVISQLRERCPVIREPDPTGIANYVRNVFKEGAP